MRLAQISQEEHCTLVDLLCRRSEEHPERPAYTFLANGTIEAATLSYGELDRQARAIAVELLRSARPGDRAVLLYPPGLDFVTALFGCFYAGVIAVPAYPPRPNRANSRLQAIVEESLPGLVLTTAPLLARREPLTREVPRLAESRWVATDDLPAESADAWRPPGLDSDSLAFLQYTSGSTSDPKGVMVSHGNFLANERMIRDLCGHSEQTVFVGWLPLYHDMGLMGNVIQPLYIGGRSILMAPSAFLSSPVRWLEAISRYRATTSGGPNFAYDLCVRRIGPEQRARLDLSSWTVAFNGAEPIRAETLERFASAFADCGFSRATFFPCYGLAEATLLVTGSGRGEGPVTRAVDSAALARHEVVPGQPGEGGRALVSSGRPAEGLAAVVVDPEARTLCPPGRVGEIWIAGPSVARGYWNRPQETEEVFGARLDDGSVGAFLRTGDLGFLADGELFVTGRLKDLIILRGRNHYPQDIELTTELSHPALQPGSTAAFSIEVDGEERLTVVVERRPRSNPEESGIESVAAAVRRAVAEEHELQVHAVVLVPPGTVLKTSSGKVRRRSCRDLFLAGRLESLGVSLAGEEEIAAPVDPPSCEELLALDDATRSAALALYLRQEAGRALKVDPARIPERQPLTSLGLDSLTAVALEQRIADGLGVELPASGLLEGASLDDLAERVLAGLLARTAAFPPLPVASRRTEAPLSSMQTALWFEQQLAPESPAYNIPFAARLGAEMDLEALRHALVTLVGRHAALRSTVGIEAGQLVQRFAREPELSWTMRTVAGVEELRAAVAAEAHRPFDLERGPLFRAVLFSAPQDRVLLLVAHHLVFDGWSLWVLLDELRFLYDGRELDLPALPAEYADFVLWQGEMLAGPVGERLWQFWRAELPAGMPPLQLPADRQAAGPSWRGAAHRFPVDRELIGRLKSLAREEGTTLYAVLLAAYQALLARSTGQLEIVVGSAMSGRSRPEFRDLVGCLFNTVPLQADFAEDPAFRGLLRQVRGRLAAALAHQDFPSHRLAERLRSSREADGAPFFQTHFLYQKPQRGEMAPRLLSDGSVRLDLGGLVLDMLFVGQEAARAGLELEVFETDEAVVAWFRYNTARFETVTVERMARHFTALLTAAVDGADRPVSDLPLLEAAERDLLLRTWSSTGREYPALAGIQSLFAEQAARAPDRVAAVCGGEALLYRELDERSGRLARRLAGLDGDLVGLMVEPDHGLLVGMLGILKAGKGFVPLDRESPAERLERMVADSGLAILATDRRNLARAEEIARRSAVVHVICLDDLDDDEPDREPLTAAGAAGEGTAYVIFTSGSTGVPKGVPITHENLVPLLLWSREMFGFGEHTRVLQSLSYTFDFGVFEILTTVLFGGTLVLRGGAERSDVEDYLQDFRRHAINTLHTTPSFFRALARAAADAGERLDSLEVLHLGGEALGERLVEEAFAVTGEGCRLFNGYGPTEATVNCALFEVGRAADWRPRGLASVPIGHPSAANRLYVLDRRMQPVPVGSPGELFVGGVGLSRGYLNRPDLTAARFVPDPFEGSGGRLYRTGDLVRFQGDGAIEFLGRVDNQVKVRGYRIELEEIEAALATHPEVGSCAVVAWRPAGGEARLVAYLAARHPRLPDTAELRSFLGRTLPPYMVPAAFIILPELPLSSSGKVDRRALPAPADAQPAVPYAAPRTPLEAALAGIWSRHLGVERVGIHDDFFELGGHSLLGTRIIAQIRKELGVEVALRTFFESPTVAELAAAVEGAGRVDLPPILPVPRDGDLPLSFPQERIWFLTQLDPELLSYHVPRALRVRGRFEPVLVEATFSEIDRRHEILRTTFPAVEGRPVQVIHPPFRMALPVVDLSALPVEMRETEMRHRILVEGRRPFDLARGPLLRLALLRLAAEEHTLVITEHHLVHDGWTQGVLLRDFLTLYDAFSRGEPSPLPELPVQYADFAVWQRRWLRDEILERQIAWWKERLTGAPTVLDLPADRPRPAVQSFQGDQERWVLPAGLSRAVRALGRRLGSTLFMSMLSAWDILLMRLSGQEDLCVGTGVANRRVVEAEGLLGMVINTLVLRADLSGDPAFAELVARTREMCVGAYGHQDVPFEKLVSALRIERSLSHAPLFQVFFAFLDTPMPELEIPGLSITVLDAHNRSAKFDINVTVLLPNEQRVGIEGQREDEITLLFEYSTDLFERTTVLRMLESFQVLLEAAVADPGRRLADLPLLSQAEIRQAVAGWNQTRSLYPREATIQELFEAQVEETPDATAVVGEGTAWSYRELNRRANRLAHHLRAQGVGPEVPVGLYLERSPELIAAIVGILKAGGVYVPLDASYPEERLRFLRADSGVRLLVSREDLDRADDQREENPEPLASADHLAYVMYTSGSTGVPKGVAVPHRAVVRLVHSTDYVRLGSTEVFLQLAPASFDASTFEIWGALLHGARLVVPPGRVPSLAELEEVLERHGVTTLWLTAGLFHQMVDERLGALAGVRQLLAGGDVLSPLHVRRVLAELPGCTLINGYGPTENTTFTCCRPLTGPWQVGASVSIGRPIANTRVHLLDRSQQPVPAGAPGELYAGGDGLARGYLGRPALTAERFVPDPFGAEMGEPGGRLYRTGDRARRLADGTLEFLGRLDGQVKVRGFRIELGEIEVHLLSHPAVQAAAAAVYEAAPGDRRVGAWLVAATQPAPAADELRRFLADSLPEHMLPAAWVWLAALPLTPNGKVDRKALPRPEASRPELAAAFVAPRTGLERALAAAWSEVLGTDEVGVHDNFFDLGGHSLLATRLMARIESRLGLALPLRCLFEAPTVAALAGRVEQALGEETGRPPAPPLTAGPRPAELPLSFAQERLWLLEQLEGASARYNVPCAVRFTGALDPAALAGAINQVVRRHEALRTRFTALPGEPRQVIEPARPVPLPVVDLTGASETEALRLAASESARPFDLGCAPLLRACLLRRSAEDHLLMLTLHHIAADGWSLGVLVRELAAFYRGEILAELPLQYADFALWQRRWLSGETLAQEVSWWRDRLAGAPEEIPLPIDRPQTATPTNRGGRCRLALPLPAGMAAVCRELQATLFMVLLAGFATLLSRWSDEEDLVVGSPVANRNRVETEGLIGFFVNMLPLRIHLAGQPSFAGLLASVREVTLAAYAHQDLPFEKLVEALQPSRHLGRTPLFQVTLTLQNAPFTAVELPGLSWKPLPVETGTAKFDLALSLEQQGESLEACLEYSLDRFDRATAERLLACWRNVLDGGVADPEARISDLPLLSSTEHRQAVAVWNETRSLYPREATIQELFEAQVEATPDAAAVVGDGVVWSYRELNRRANRLAHHLRAQGVGPEVPVGLSLERSPELIAAILGILKAGGVYVPLDTSYPEERLRFLRADSGVRLLVSREDLDRSAGHREDNPAPSVSADHLAYVMYTSGSTGMPKGVAVPHRAVVRLVQGTDYVLLGPAEVFLQLAPVSFDASTFEIWGALLHGARLAVFPGRVPSIEELEAALQQHGVTTLWLTAGLFHQIVDERPGALAGVRQLLAGGDVLSAAHVRRVLEELPGCTLINGYGPTENTTFTCCRPLTGPDAAGASVPIGRPIANTQVYLLDQSLHPVPVGVAGELYAGGDGLARGYLGRPELTAERFVPDPFGAGMGEAGGRLYRTGDLARRRMDGDIELLGRTDQQVKIRGFRVEPGEVEATLRKHPQVLEAVVVAREVAGAKALVAYVVGTESRLATGDLRQHLREHLPEHMVPAAFVALPRLPLTPNGKVDRRALPEPERGSAPAEPSAPGTLIEDVLTGIWAEMLGLERVGAHESFFDLGGHSLLATRVVSRLRAVFGVELPLRALFERPSVAELAALIEEARYGGTDKAAPPLVPVPRDGDLPLSFAQERLWFLDQLQPGSPVYNMPVALRLLGGLSVSGLQESLSELVRRHESLRTVFVQAEGQPVQRVLPPAVVPLGLIDLGGLDPQGRESELSRLSQEHAERPFDLARGPLLRGSLVRLGDAEHAMLLNQHHIVSDGWSIGVLMREVVTLYGAFAARHPSPLPELAIQYADFAVWQRRWLTGDVLERQVSYWKERLSGMPALLELPADRPRPAFRTGRGSRRAFHLPAETLRGLKALGRREGATDFMILLSLFQAFLSRLAGQEDFAIGTVIANRVRAELEPLIGFFANTLVLRGDLSGRPSLRDLLLRNRESALAAYAHQDLPFEHLVEVLQPVRTTSHTSLFQVMLVLQTALDKALSVPGLEAVHIEGSTRTGGARFDLTLDLEETPLGLAGSLEYATDLFDATTVSRWAGQWATLLAEAVAEPARAVPDLPLLGAAERQQLVLEWNDTKRGRKAEALGAELLFSTAQRIHELFERQAALRPLAVAVAGQGQTLSYAELEIRANRLAHHLRRLGVGAETRVGLCVERSPEMVVALLGILKSGGTYVPLDPSHPAERLALVLGDIDLAVLVTEERWLERLRVDGRAAGFHIVCVDRDRERIAIERGTSLDGPSNVGPESLAYVIYTSGSTGRPKGVCLPHGAVVSFLAAMAERLKLGAAAVVPALTTLTFDIAGLEIYLPLALGGRVEVVGREEAADGHRLAARLACGMTAMQATPATWRLLLDAGWEGQPGLKALCGGELLPRALASALQARGVELWNLYGPTETAVWSAAGAVPEPGESVAVDLGRPIAETRCHVVDRELALLPLGAAGELLIGGAGVARGYWGQPAWTAERFVPDPFLTEGGPGGRLYRTGDLVRWLPDGRLDYLGRMDHQVKVRGFRIELEEIENALCCHGGVAQAVAGLRPGPGDQTRLVAYVVAREGAAPAVSELSRHLRTLLPDYMIPSAWVFLDALPLTPNGKLDRRSLPEPEPAGPEGEGAALRTPAEELLAGIWAEVLRVESVGGSDDFFALGGHSLLATKVVSRVRQAFGIELAVRELFEAPTVAGLAARLAGRASAAAQPITATPHTTTPPLSFAQMRLWFLDQLQPGSWHYNLPHAVRVEGPLAPELLARCLGEVVRRHDVLRASFPPGDEGEARQRIAPPRPFVLPLIDLTALPAGPREREQRRLEAAEARRPFDLVRGELLRALLVRLAAGAAPEHTLLLTLHHIVADAWSIGLLIEEAAQLYTALTRGLPSPLPELPIQYGDFARWQRQHLSGRELAVQLAWWREHLAGAPLLLELPTDRSRPPVQSFRGALHRFALPAGSEAAFARRHDVTLFMAFLAGFQALLGRLAGTDDLVVGSPIANRNRTEIEGLIGFFANTLVLRGGLAGNPAFRELLARVRRTALGAYEHQDLPFERLVEELAPERDLSRAPVFQVAFVVQNAPLVPLELPGLTLRPLPGEGGAAKFDLMLTLLEHGEGVAGVFEYATDLFDPTTVERWAGHLTTLLAEAMAEPDRRLSELSLLSAGERHQMLREWSDPEGAFPAGECLHRLFATQAARRPDATAVVFGEERLSYGELAARAERLARRLHALGVEPGGRVGIFLDRSVETVVAILGVLAAGGAYVPLDPAYPKEHVAWVLEDAGVRVLLARRGPFEGANPAGAALAGLAAPPAVVWLEEDGPEAAAEGGGPGSAASPESLAYVIYTSGSTGRPKGVQVTHGNVARLLTATERWFGFGVDDVWTLFHSYAFDFSVWEMWGALAYGGCLVVVPYWVSRSPEAFVPLLLRERVTVLNQTPSAFRQLLRAEEERGEAGGELALRWVIFGGEALEPQVLEPWLVRHGDRRPRLVNMYGITETTVHVTFRPLSASDTAAGSVVGCPIPDLQVHLLDPFGGPVPVGVPGEIHVGGAGVARGYLNRPGLTAERFVPDAWSGRAGARLYRSGDLARFRATGDLEYLGRIDQQLKVRGFRIEPGEIEAALTAHPQVREAVVVAREERAGELRLVAYVVVAAPAPGPRPLRAHLQERLPEHMIPAVFVVLDRLPLTPNGKVDRRALPAPEPRLPEGEETAPRTPAEGTLARIWTELLRLERVGVHDNFFDLGGDSILSIQIVARARRAGLFFEPREIFEHQTIAELAAVARSGAAPGGGQGLVTGSLPLTPIQRWLLERELLDLHHFNQSVLLASRAPLQAAALARAADCLLAHHDALRLRLERGEDGWRQHMAGLDAPVPFTWIDLSALPPGMAVASVEAAAAAVQAGFDLARGPLVRFAAFSLGEERPGRLLIAVHHWAIDGVSWRILLEDLASAYGQAVRGEEITLPAKSASYRDWALHLEAAAGTAHLAAEVAHWREAARGGELPRLARPDLRGADTVAVARSVSLSLAPEETRALLREVPEVYRTRIDEVLLAALARAFALRRDVRSLRVDVEGHGREPFGAGLDLSRTVGWFTAIYPVLLEIADPADPGACLREVKERLRLVPGRGIGYGLLRYLCTDATAGPVRELPQAEIVFNYLGQLDQALPEDAPFLPASESRGLEQSPRDRRPYLLEVSSRVVGGRFQTTWTYGSRRLAREEVAGLVEAFIDALRDCIRNCREPQDVEYTAADFPNVILTEEQLARALSEIELE